jgi:hypothetical protein
MVALLLDSRVFFVEVEGKDLGLCPFILLPNNKFTFIEKISDFEL